MNYMKYIEIAVTVIAVFYVLKTYFPELATSLKV